MAPLLWFLLGLVVGANFGFVIFGLLHAAIEDRQRSEGGGIVASPD